MKKLLTLLFFCVFLASCSKNPDVIALKCTGKLNSLTSTGSQINEYSETKITSFVATRTNKSIFEIFQEPQYIVRFENLSFDKNDVFADENALLGRNKRTRSADGGFIESGFHLNRFTGVFTYTYRSTFKIRGSLHQISEEFEGSCAKSIDKI